MNSVIDLNFDSDFAEFDRSGSSVAIAERDKPVSKPSRKQVLPPDGEEDVPMQIPLVNRRDGAAVGRFVGKKHPRPIGGNRSPAGSRRKRNPCHDYFNLGYCMRGDRCRFDHGRDPVVVGNSSVLPGRQNVCYSDYFPGLSGVKSSVIDVVAQPPKPKFDSSVLTSPVVPKTPFNTPTGRGAQHMCSDESKKRVSGLLGNLFKKSYPQPVTPTGEIGIDKQPKDSAERVLLDLHRQRVELYKKNAEQQRTLLQMLQAAEEGETKQKFLKLVKTNGQLLQTLKLEIELLGHDVLALGKKKRQEEEDQKQEVCPSESKGKPVSGGDK